MKKGTGYTTLQTEDVLPFQAYTHDFLTSGEFSEEEVEEGGKQVIYLQAILWPGKYNGESWKESTGTEGDSYAIFLYYYNRHNVEIIFDASYGDGEDLIPSFDFVRSAAKKFFLVNEYVMYKDPSASEKQAGYLDSGLSWEDVEKLIGEKARNQHDLRSGNSWYKVMPIDKARELINYLGLRVNFPKYEEE